MSIIPPEQIERIKESNDIVDLVGSFVKLTRRGHNHWALCPFHSEDTPSFSVSAERQFYHCFGCGEGGNVISFVMQHEKMGFIEAVTYLAERAGITMEQISSGGGGAEPEIKDKIYYANKIAHDFFTKSLSGAGGKVAVEYLKNRKVSPKVCKEFGIGYAPDKSNGLVQYASQKEISRETMIAAGLATSSDYGVRDFFRGRLIFPFRNLSGRIVAFGGRALKDGEPAKYINTRETPIYRKGSLLFGLDLTKDHIRKSKQALIVEGYTDLISLHSDGIKNVVCSSGTAFTSAQAALVSRFADKVITVFDGDAAGLKATSRSVGELLSKGVEVMICLLPEGEDPDSIIKAHGAEELRKHLSNALTYPEFKRATIGKNFKQLSVMEKEKLMTEIGEIINQIGDPLRRKLFVDDVERVFDFPITTYSRARVAKNNTAGKQKAANRDRTTIEREFLALLARNEERLPEVSESIAAECFTDSGCRTVYEKMLSQYSEHGALKLATWVKVDTDPKIIKTLAEMDNLTEKSESWQAVFDDYLKRFKADQTKMVLNDIKARILSAEQKGEAATASDLQKRYLRVLVGGTGK